MAVRIRFRADGCHYVQMRAKGTEWAEYFGVSREAYEALPPGEPGDIWRIRWYKEGGGEGPIAGYAIWCPECNDLHHWTTATNCAKGATGACVHSGIGSCWEWTGSAEDGTLTARPSLLCHSCGFHGWLTNGSLADC
jgi:hypothetical protein